MVVIKPQERLDEDNWDGKVSSIKNAIVESFVRSTAANKDHQEEVQSRLSKLDEDFSSRVDNLEVQ